MHMCVLACVYDEKPDKMRGGERSRVQDRPDLSP